MSISVKSGNSTNLLTVNDDNEALVALTTDPAKSGYARLLDTAGRDISTTENGYVRTSGATLMCYDQIEGSAINTNIWNPWDSTTAIAQANGFITLNPTSIITATQYWNLKTIDVLPLYGSLPMLPELTVKTVNLPQSGVTAEIGCIMASAGAAPTDGCFFRYASSGAFYAVISYGGVETSSANLAGTTASDDDGDSIALPPANLLTHLFAFEIVEDLVLFSIDDVIVATVVVPTGQAFPFNNGRQSIGMRMYWTTAPSIAPQVSLGQFTAKYEDLNQNRSWPELMAILGKGGYQSPITPFGQTANHANSTNPTSATLSNTAAGYTAPDGEFQFAAVAGAATDYALFAYQVPLGFKRIIYGISISCASTGALGSVTVPTLLRWSLGINSSAVSLATADGTNTWAPRRKPLGLQSFGLTTALGAMATDLVRTFPVPFVVNSQRFLHLILQVPVGAATASQIFRGTVTLNSYDE